jgi:ABC-type multidrug transport system ATPase subunit
VDVEKGGAGKEPEPEQTGSFLRQLSSHDSANSMEWSDLTFGIKGKTILDRVTGGVEAGEMACILGPSGAGKSTLLNILAGRMNTAGKGYNYSGTISMGGSVVRPVDVRSSIAYVMQEDALPAMTTPRELLEMSAMLRLKGEHGSRDKVREQVSHLLRDLRLEKCADTYVGSALFKGISGGEKKRTSVGVELITRPKMIFLDEPLSGLDSYAAWTVMQVCKDLASHGCAVLCTIHQPSSEIFEMFDKCICLAEGRTVYCGAVNDVGNYMGKVGLPVSKQHNPADHLLFTVQKQSQEELGEFTENWVKEESNIVRPPIEQKREGRQEQAKLIQMVPRKSFCTQLSFLVSRELKELFRNKIGLFFRFVVTGVMGVLFAAIFAGIGGKEKPGSHFGAIVNLMIGVMFGSAQPLLLQFPLERPIFLREYAANMYGVVPYFLAKTLVEAPMSFLTSLETFLISYWIMDLQGNFFFLVCTGWALSMTAASTALMVGCSVPNAQSAQELAPLIFVPQILFTGIFVSIDLIPKALRWMQYLCALKYAVDLGVVIELGDNPLAQGLLEEQNIHKDQVGLYVGVLAGIFCGFRLLAMINLGRRAQFVF